jgi:hypothetical protein
MLVVVVASRHTGEQGDEGEKFYDFHQEQR